MKKARKKEIRSVSIRLRLTKEEYSSLAEKQRLTTCPSLSYYIRQMIFRRRIIKTVRNLSQDSVLEELSKIQRELERIGLYRQEFWDFKGPETEVLKNLLIKLNDLIKQSLKPCTHELNK